MEVHMKGPGEIVVSLVDRAGTTLGQQSMRVSGSPRVEAKMRMPLVLSTQKGAVGVSPVLLKRSAKQEVMFDGAPAAEFTARRCKEIGCSAKVAADAVKGVARPLAAASAKTRGKNGILVHAPRAS